ncbi:MAG: thiamine phosphate synthase [Pseudohongiellaceae bacterium]
MSIREMKGVYAITDDRLLPGEDLYAAVTMALDGGIAAVQYRSKGSDDGQQVEIAQLLCALCREYDVPLLINDDVELCQLCGADGVHLGQRDAGVAEARKTLGPKALIGVTCNNSLEHARNAQNEGASYVAFGRFFPSLTKPAAPGAELGLLVQAKEELVVPIVAIGGITEANAASVIEAGADMIAVIHGLFGCSNVEHRARKLCRLFDQRELNVATP